MLIGIFGTGRNGSSLLGRLLDGLGDTYMHPVEEKFFSGFNDLVGSGKVSRLVEQNCTTKTLADLDRKIRCSQAEIYFNTNSLNELYQHCQSTVGDILNRDKLLLCDLLTDEDLYIEDFISQYLKSISIKLRPDVKFEHYMFKTIETPYLDEYEKRFPDMRFIHIMRHPVDVCSSQKRSLMENKQLPASYLGYDWMTCMLDKRWIPHAKFLLDHKNDPRHIVVRYEDLVKEPVREIERIAGQLGVTPPQRPEIQTVFHDLDRVSWGGNPSKKGVVTPEKVIPDLQLVNQYTEILTRREIDLVSMKTRALLDQFDYRSRSEAGLPEVVMEYVLPDRWELMYWRSPKLFLQGLFGLLYRRYSMFKN